MVPMSSNWGGKPPLLYSQLMFFISIFFVILPPPPPVSPSSAACHVHGTWGPTVAGGPEVNGLTQTDAHEGTPALSEPTWW